MNIFKESTKKDGKGEPTPKKEQDHLFPLINLANTNHIYVPSFLHWSWVKMSEEKKQKHGKCLANFPSPMELLPIFKYIKNSCFLVIFTVLGFWFIFFSLIKCRQWHANSFKPHMVTKLLCVERCDALAHEETTQKKKLLSNLEDRKKL